MTPGSQAGDYLALDDEALLAECTLEMTRGTGPGGQHRNKTSTGVRLRHRPTGLVGQAFERRSQAQNREAALDRLRQAIAFEVRTPVNTDAYHPSPALEAILPTAKHQRIGPNHPRYWAGVQRLLDLFEAQSASVSGTAAALGVSTGALSRLLFDHPDVIAWVNSERLKRGLRPLRQ